MALHLFSSFSNDIPVTSRGHVHDKEKNGYTGDTTAGIYRSFLSKPRLHSLIIGGVLLIFALTLQSWASSYSTHVISQSVGDIILDNTPALPLSPIIVEGALLAIIGSLALLFSKPQYLLFALKAVAILIALRALLISATHLGIYPNQIAWGNRWDDWIYSRLGGEAGYFFSAHTALPFLMALILWKERLWRYVFLAISALFGAAVLLAHVHYSIDVFAAPFMTYSIFKLAQYLFPADYALMESDRRKKP
jgi:hypothetical protein